MNLKQLKICLEYDETLFVTCQLWISLLHYVEFLKKLTSVWTKFTSKAQQIQ